MPQPHVHEQCIRSCQLCFEVCIATADGHCLERGGAHAQPQHLKRMHDCADICRLSATLLLRDSPLHPKACALCLEVCASCAQDCARFNDEVMQRCSEACRRCADECWVMVKAHQDAA